MFSESFNSIALVLEYMEVEPDRVNVAVEDRILLHLMEHDDQADRHTVSASVTRNGIAEACALHPPNVSRAMRNLDRRELVNVLTRNVHGDSRRQRTWQLTEDGRSVASQRIVRMSSIRVSIRNQEGTMLTVRADEAAERIDAQMSLLQVLMHAQHEGVLHYGDIRFGSVRRSTSTPSPISLLKGAHSTYHVRPPSIRKIHGRKSELKSLDDWFEGRAAGMLVHGIAGTGKTTLISHWTQSLLDRMPSLRLMFYPCHPWDSPLGLSISLLHRLGVESRKEGRWDPHDLLDTLPKSPGAPFDIDLFRRRLIEYLTDPMALRERIFTDHEGTSDVPPYILLVIDDAHHLAESGQHLFGALLQVAEVTPLRLLFVSRTTMSFYDRRDVLTRGKMEELPVSGLSLEVVRDWLNRIDAPKDADADSIHRLTGGHPLALELLEIYGKVVHEDWLKFLDQEILDVLPEQERRILNLLASVERPILWEELGEAIGAESSPPNALIESGLIVELEDGMWLHDAMRERLRRDLGAMKEASSKIEK